MLRRKAFLHWYTGEGMDEMEFTGARIKHEPSHLRISTIPGSHEIFICLCFNVVLKFESLIGGVVQFSVSNSYNVINMDILMKFTFHGTRF